jgi:hypothetical protein
VKDKEKYIGKPLKGIKNLPGGTYPIVPLIVEEIT